MWCILLLVSAGCARAGHSAFNTSDVITTYQGHADAGPQQYRGSINTGVRKESDRIERYGERKGDKLRSDDDVREEKKGAVGQDSDYLEDAGTGTTEPSDGVVFVPSGNREREPQFSGRRGGRQKVTASDVVERVAVGDIINERIVTEQPEKNGVFFKPGKNNEQTELEIKHEARENERIEKNLKDFKEVTENPIDCHNLDCQNFVQSVCGVKLQNKRRKHRLFMNECYFRKVNCGLQYEYNRYLLVPLEECDGVGSHTPPGSERTVWQQYYAPKPLPARRSGGTKQNVPRDMPSRRAITSEMNGLACAHQCPARCPDEYNPVCAYAYPMQRKVFQNHCLLDLQSCDDGSEWHERPLSDCAGVAKAEVHERAAFIGWMQRMGILNKKGQLVQ